MDDLFLRFRRTGDRDALERLARENLGWVYGVCLSVTREPALAEEAAQETFLRLVRSASTFREEGSFRGWLYRIAQNAARTQKAQRGDRTMDPRDLDQNPVTEGSREAEAIREALTRLPEEFRRPSSSTISTGFPIGKSGRRWRSRKGQSPRAFRPDGNV